MMTPGFANTYKRGLCNATSEHDLPPAYSEAVPEPIKDKHNNSFASFSPLHINNVNSYKVPYPDSCNSAVPCPINDTTLFNSPYPHSTLPNASYVINNDKSPLHDSNSRVSTQTTKY